jgi:hypothetical protein
MPSFDGTLCEGSYEEDREKACQEGPEKVRRGLVGSPGPPRKWRAFSFPDPGTSAAQRIALAQLEQLERCIHAFRDTRVKRISGLRLARGEKRV